VIDLLGEDVEAIPAAPEIALTTLDKLGELEARYLHAGPEVKERVSRSIERGPIGALVKNANGFKCQLCDALGLDPIGFKKRNGEPYVEAHHMMPVSTKQIGSLAASNVLTVCANHHREIHYGCIEVNITDTVFDIVISGKHIQISRLKIATGSSTGANTPT
jgi:hypothetical protein